jgi:tryptophan synthase alpha chain
VSQGNRIARRFADLRAARRSGLVVFLTAGDPTPEVSLELLLRMSDAGADVIELGVPFSDPMADGPAIQAASLRALRQGQTLARTLDQVARFRQVDGTTPIILFGYYNPILSYGVERFTADARDAGVDGLIVVDLPPEEMAELREPATAAGLDMVLLVAPTTDDARLDAIVQQAQGFLYSVAITGITGTRSATAEEIGRQVERIRARTALPVAVGFGIKTPAQAATVACAADAAVVGSALVSTIASHVSEDGKPSPSLVPDAVSFVRQLAEAVAAATVRD